MIIETVIVLTLKERRVHWIRLNVLVLMIFKNVILKKTT